MYNTCIIQCTACLLLSPPCFPVCWGRPGLSNIDYILIMKNWEMYNTCIIQCTACLLLSPPCLSGCWGCPGLSNIEYIFIMKNFNRRIPMVTVAQSIATRTLTWIARIHTHTYINTITTTLCEAPAQQLQNRNQMFILKVPEGRGANWRTRRKPRQPAC